MMIAAQIVDAISKRLYQLATPFHETIRNADGMRRTTG
jgi:hypothetical protein